MPRTDLALALLLAALTAASRVPFRSRILSTWDAVQFALALEDYDLVKHQPHPPGYILYVGAARAVRALVGDPAASLTWLAVAASAVTIFLVYRLAWTQYDRTTALAAATTLAVSPLFWVNGEMALSYTAEAALATLVATLVWPMGLGQTRYVGWSALALGCAGGMRQSLLLLLAPLWLGMAYAGVRRWRPILGGCALIALTTAAWFVPMVWLTGGLERYVWASRELFDSTVRATTIIGPAGAWLANVRGLRDACLMGLGVLCLVLAWLILRGVRRAPRWGAREWFRAGWILPPLTVYTFVHFGQYAYLLTVLPALYIWIARWLVVTFTDRATPRRAALTAAVAGVVLAHTAFFVGAGPVDVPELAAGTSGLERWKWDLRAFYRFRLWGSTASGVREQGHVIATYVSTIRRDFDATDTVLVTELGNPRSYPWFRHVTYYLREFSVYHLRLGGFSPGYLSSRRLESMAALDGPDIVVPSSVRRVVWVVDSWNPSLPRPRGLQERVLPYGRKLYVLESGGRVVEHNGYRLTPLRAAGHAADTGCAPSPRPAVNVVTFHADPRRLDWILPRPPSRPRAWVTGSALCGIHPGSTR